MTRLIEGTHYMRRENQPSPAPHKYKEAIDCLFCSDHGDDGNEQVGHVRRKRSRPIGLNIYLEGVIEGTYYTATNKKTIDATAKHILILWRSSAKAVGLRGLFRYSFFSYDFFPPYPLFSGW